MSVLTKEVIFGLVGSCLIERFDGSLKTPECHFDWWELCCSKAKFVAIAAPRGHAKSTAITLSYTLSAVLFRERKFVLIVSDTEAQACLFLGQIKQELMENEAIVKLFGIKKNDKGFVEFIKETESDIIVECTDGYKFRIMAKGAEQKLRGLLWDGKRPDLIVCDDLENDEIVMNKDRREKFKRWFYGALLPCRSKDGVVRYVGTILHMDSMLENLMPRESNKETIIEDLKTYSTRNVVWKSVKYRAHNSDFTKILWPDKFSKEELKGIRQDYIERGLPDVYSQEYLNIPIDESVTYFKKADFQTSKNDENEVMNYYVAADLAISENERADYTAFVVGGLDSEGRLHIKNVIRARMDGQEIVDTILALQKTYNPEIFGIEDMQVTKSIGPFLREAMMKSNIFPSIELLKPHKTDKLTRARSIQARMRAGGVRFDKSADWYQMLEDEMIRFPRDKHDDQVDAMAYLGLLIDKFVEAPTKEELLEEEYEHELERSSWNYDGRNSITGY